MVFVCGLESDPIHDVERELNELGKESGGAAKAYVLSSSDMKYPQFVFR